MHLQQRYLLVAALHLLNFFERAHHLVVILLLVIQLRQHAEHIGTVEVVGIETFVSVYRFVEISGIDI